MRRFINDEINISYMTDVARLVEEGIPTEFGVFYYLDDTKRMYVGETGVKLANQNADLVNRLIDNPESANDFPSLGKGAEGDVYRIGMCLDGSNLDTAVKIYHPDRLKGITQYVSHLKIPQKSEFMTPKPYFASDRVFAMELMNENLCAICLTNKSQYVFIPCGHYCMCNECEINFT